MRDEMFEQPLEREDLRFERDRSVRARLTDRYEREHVEAEARLQRRVFEKLIEHDFRRRAALQLDDDAHPFAIRLIVEPCDPLNTFLRIGFRDRLDDAALV